MKDRKKALAYLSLVVFGGFVLLYRIVWGTQLDDAEFDAAVARASDSGIPDLEEIAGYPFEPVPRAQAALWYVHLAQDIQLMPSSSVDDCVFDDIADLPTASQRAIILSCQYDFFKGTDGHFYPDAYVTKANSLVGLMRGLSPLRTFPDVQPYWTPYVDLAYDQGITQRPSGPYLMYLITRYELLLQLYRVYRIKS